MTKEEKVKFLVFISNNEDYQELARKSVEDFLIEMRDGRMQMPLRRNGLVIYERNGEPSSVIRFGMETAFSVALRAIADDMLKNDQD